MGRAPRGAARRAGRARHQRRHASRALGRVVGLPHRDGAPRGRDPDGRVAAARAARPRGRGRRGGSGPQVARRAPLARARCGPGARPAGRRREPPREPRPEPRELGRRPGRHARRGIRGRAPRGRPWSAWRSAPTKPRPRASRRASATRCGRRSPAGAPSLLVLNRLGYARTLACAECGAVRRCRRCRLALLYHRETRTLACRLCGRRRAGGEPLRPLPGPPAPAPRLGDRAARGGSAAGLPGARRSSATTRPSRRTRPRRRGRRSSRARPESSWGPRWRSGWPRRRPWPSRRSSSPMRRSTSRTSAPPSGRSSWRGGWVRRSSPGGASGSSRSCRTIPRCLAVAAGEPDRFYEAEWAERRELGYPPARRMARLLAEGREADAARPGPGRARAGGRRDVLGPAPSRGRARPGGAPGRRRPPGDGRGGPRAAPGRRRLRGARLTVDIDPVELP